MIADFNFVGKEGSLKWELNPKTGVLKISGFGSVPSFPDDCSLRPSWTRFRSYIREVRFSEGIVHIGAYSFFPFDYGKLSDLRPNLRRVVFPGTLRTIGESAFRANPLLASIDFCLCRNLEGIESQAFASCYQLKAVDFSGCPHLKTIAADAFDSCDKLVRINVAGCRFLDPDTTSLLKKRIPPSTKVIEIECDRRPKK